jgi:hypothetical protein
MVEYNKGIGMTDKNERQNAASEEAEIVCKPDYGRVWTNAPALLMQSVALVLSATTERFLHATEYRSDLAVPSDRPGRNETMLLQAMQKNQLHEHFRRHAYQFSSINGVYII